MKQARKQPVLSKAALRQFDLDVPIASACLTPIDSMAYTSTPMTAVDRPREKSR
jgi:hypothetical protein